MTRSKRATKALEGSILKWENIVAGTGEDYGEQNCPLCQLYNGSVTGRDLARCSRTCPVVVATSKSFCEGTPYGEYLDIPSAKTAAKMLAFLKSLR